MPNSLNGPRRWRIFVQRQVCASVIIILHVREENMAQVSFAEDDDMIKTFPSDRTNQSFVPAIAVLLAGHESPSREDAV